MGKLMGGLRRFLLLCAVVLVLPAMILSDAGFAQGSTPVFVYPIDGQTIDYEGSYLFKVEPIANAQGFLWGFFQNGVMVWENFRDGLAAAAVLKPTVA